MKRPAALAIALLTVTVVSAAAISRRVQAATWEQRLGLLISTPDAGPNRGGSRMTRHGSNLRWNFRRPARLPRTDVNLEGEELATDSLLRDGRTFVPLREFLGELQERYGIRFQIDYEGRQGVRLRRLDSGRDAAPRTAEQWFGQGWACLWDGNVPAALKALDRAASYPGAEAEQARALAGWLREESPDGADVGIIRFEWWNIPPGYRIYIDKVEVVQGAIWMRAPVGEHQLRVESQSGRLLIDKTIQVINTRAHGITFMGGPVGAS